MMGCLCYRPYLLRDVYDDMMLDGIQPTRDIFYSLISGTMKGARLQDSFFFRDEMKSKGLFPDVSIALFLVPFLSPTFHLWVSWFILLLCCS